MGVLVGVLISQRFRQEAMGAPKIEIDIFNVVIAFIVSLIILPRVFKEPNFAEKIPFLAKIGLSVQNGLFFDVLIEKVIQNV